MPNCHGGGLSVRVFLLSPSSHLKRSLDLLVEASMSIFNTTVLLLVPNIDVKICTTTADKGLPGLLLDGRLFTDDPPIKGT